MIARVNVLWFSIMIAPVWTDAWAEPTCKVQEDAIIDKCKVVTLDPQCLKHQVPKYLRRLTRLSKMASLPQVTHLNIDNHKVENGIGFLNVSWHFSSRGYHLNGFLIEVFSEIHLNSSSRYFIAEYRRKGTHNFSFQMDYMTFEASEQSTISISIWSLIHVKKSKNQKKLSNTNICRHFTEMYDNSRISTVSKLPTVKRLHEKKKRAKPYEEINTVKGPCSCWKDEELKVTTNLSNIYVTSTNLCMDNYPDIWITGQYIILENYPLTSIHGTEFSNTTNGLHEIKILFKCNVLHSDPPTCSKNTKVNITALPRYLGLYEDDSGKDIFVVSFAVIAVPLAFAILGLLLFLLLRNRWKKTLAGDKGCTSLLPKRILFVCLSKDSSRKDRELTKHFDQMLREFKITADNSDNIFRKIFEGKDNISLKILKFRLREEIVGFNHFLIITTKDLYESFESVGRTKLHVDKVSVKDSSLLYYFLAEAVINRMRTNIDNQQLTSNFIAPDESSRSYQKKIYSFMKPPKGVGRTYCLSKQSKFDKVKFSVLVQSLPKTIRNKELIHMLHKLDPKKYLEILEQPNNQTRATSQPTSSSSSEKNQTDVNESDTSSTMVKSADATGKQSHQTFLKFGASNCNDTHTIPKDIIGQKTDQGSTKVKTFMSDDNEDYHLNDGKHPDPEPADKNNLVSEASHDTRVKDVCDLKSTVSKVVKDEMPHLNNLIECKFKEKSVKFCLETTKIMLSVDQDNTRSEEVRLKTADFDNQELPGTNPLNVQVGSNKESVDKTSNRTVNKKDISVWQIQDDTNTELGFQEDVLRNTMKETCL